MEVFLLKYSTPPKVSGYHMLTICRPCNAIHKPITIYCKTIHWRQNVYKKHKKETQTNLNLCLFPNHKDTEIRNQDNNRFTELGKSGKGKNTGTLRAVNTIFWRAYLHCKCNSDSGYAFLCSNNSQLELRISTLNGVVISAVFRYFL